MIPEKKNRYLLEKNSQLSISQMKLLNYLGHYPNITDRELAKKVGYRYYNYISTVKNNILKKRGYLIGPNYWIDMSQICVDKVNRLLIYIMFKKNFSYTYIINLIKNIECWSFFYPVEETTFNQMLVAIYSTDHDKVLDIFNYFLEKEIIFYFSIYELEGQLEVYNPQFIIKKEGKYYETPLTVEKINLEKEYVKNYAEKKHKNHKLSQLDTRLIMYLHAKYFNCELSKLMKYDAKKIDKNGNHPYIWGYNSWRYSYEKLIKNNIIKKYYSVYPLPKYQCAHFFMFIKGKNLNATKKLGANVGARARTLRAGSLVKSLNEHDFGDVYWSVHIRSHPLYMQKILGLLDNPIVENKIRLNVRTISSHNNKNFSVPYMNFYDEQSISLEEKYYNLKKQILNYDYNNYFKNIRQYLKKH